jgi:hydrogenase expression/formation protein HypE
MRLPPGKISKEILEEVVFKNIGVKLPGVIIGPSVGLDGAVVNSGDTSWIFSMDPITGGRALIGWLAVNINANDIATFGVKPYFFLSCILLPKNSDRKIIQDISAQIGKASKALHLAVLGGHSEVTSELHSPIVVGCMIGVSQKDRYVTAAGARPKDKIIMTKAAGIEGTAIIASERSKELKGNVSNMILARARQFFKEISVVNEAVDAFETGGVNAMHDPTEGGLAGGIHEMADASHLGVEVYEKRILIRRETEEICRFFNIDPLQLIASGSLLIAAKPSCETKVLSTLKAAGIYARTIGEFKSDQNSRQIIRENGKIDDLVRTKSDHLWKALGE